MRATKIVDTLRLWLKMLRIHTQMNLAEVVKHDALGEFAPSVLIDGAMGLLVSTAKVDATVLLRAADGVAPCSDPDPTRRRVAHISGFPLAELVDLAQRVAHMAFGVEGWLAAATGAKRTHRQYHLTTP